MKVSCWCCWKQWAADCRVSPLTAYGPAETIRNGEDGFLVENGNIKEFAEALCHFIEHEEERKSFGHRARKNIERYAPEVIMPMWEKLFNELKEK